MKILFILFGFCSLTMVSQNTYSSLDTVKAPAVFENVYVRPLYKDSVEVSSYVIFIKTEIKLHKHVEHAEHVVVLAGNGEMTLGDKKFFIKKGDVIFIPKNTFHGVKTTSKFPLKIFSVQAPYYDGKDKVMKD